MVNYIGLTFSVFVILTATCCVEGKLRCSYMYKYSSSGSAEACLDYNLKSLNFTEAIKYCKGIGGHLMTPKSEDAVKIIRKQKNVYWVGMDDLETEDVLKWHDTKSVVEEEFRKTYFYRELKYMSEEDLLGGFTTGEDLPSDSQKKGRCVIYDPPMANMDTFNLRSFKRADCDRTRNYICQQKI